MLRGWEVELKDNTVIQEGQMEWRQIPKNQIQRLTLHYDSRRWDLTNKQAYFVKNSASMVPGVQESFRVERRCIGFYEGSTKVYYTVDEQSGKFEMRVEDNK